MAFSLPNPTSPTNGQSLDATPILANEVAIANAIASFDGSQIQNGTIPSAAFSATANPNTLIAAITSPFVQSGVVWSAISGLAGTMSGGTIYYNGTPVTINSVASKTFTASDDTYVDIDKNGNVAYPAVSNGGTPPSLTANSLRVAKIVTGSSSISSIVQSGADLLGNLIYPINPTLFNAWQPWVPTVNAFTSTTTADYYYTQIGSLVFISVSVSGTSNSSAFTITPPIPAATYLDSIEASITLGVDNGSTLTQGPRATIAPGSNNNLIVLFSNSSGSGWTNSGTKEARFQMFYQAL